MKVLVTGGTGYLGTRVAESMAGDGHELYVISRRPAREPSVGATYMQADISSPEEMLDVRREVGAVDVLVHLAARVPRMSSEDVAHDMIEMNISGTTNVLSAFSGELGQVIYGSTVEIYGLPKEGNAITECQLPRPLSNYGASKLAGEYLCHVYCQQRELPCQILRFSVMYGRPDPIDRAIPNFIMNARQGCPVEVYGGEELRDYLHVDDAVEAVRCAAFAQASGVYNIGSGEATSVRQAAESIIALMGSSSELVIRSRKKPRADLALDISVARASLGFAPSYFFPAGIEKQLSHDLLYYLH